QINSFACSRLDAEYGPLRSNSRNNFQACRGKLPHSFSGLAFVGSIRSVCGRRQCTRNTLWSSSRCEEACHEFKVWPLSSGTDLCISWSVIGHIAATSTFELPLLGPECL